MSLGEVTLDLDKPGLHLVLGLNKDSEQFDSNGSGKSSIFDAIVWALYGEILRPVSIDSLVRNDQEKCTVSVDIDTGTDIVNITRSRNIINKKSHLSVTDSSGKELFPSNSITDMQQDINTLLGLDFKTFTNSVYFGKGLSQFFMLADDKTRKDILEAILQMVDFDTVYQKVKTKHRDLNTSINTILNKLETAAEVLFYKNTAYTTAFKEYEDQKKTNTPKIEAFTKEQEEIVNKIHNYSDTLASVRRVIDKKTDIYTTLKQKIEETILFERDIITNTCNSKKEKLEQAYLHSINTLTKMYNSLIETLEEKKVKLNSEDNKLEETKDNINEESSDCRAKIDDCNNYLTAVTGIDDGAICGVCQSIVTPEHKHFVVEKFEQERKDLNTVLDSINKRRQLNNEKLKKIKEEIETIVNAKQEALLSLNNDKFFKLTNKQGLLKNIDDSLTVDVEAVRERYANRLYQEFSSFNTAVNTLKEDAAKLTAENTQLASRQILITSSLKTLEDQLTNTHTKLIELDNDIKICEEEKKENNKKVKDGVKELERLAFWVEAFSQKGIRSFIFETSLPELSSRANYYSVALSGGSISINILPTTIVKSTGEAKERLNILVNNSLGAASYDGCSEGEKRRVDLCLLLALQDLVGTRGTKSWDVSFYDELLDTLDNTGIEAVINLFKTESLNKSIYIISHNASLKNFFDTSITVVKQEGVSSLIYE
jgi:DNA repair exonuclease SbcCD ATPase subunit